MRHWWDKFPLLTLSYFAYLEGDLRWVWQKLNEGDWASLQNASNGRPGTTITPTHTPR
jgi:hypothetical protein